jgi:hypothetical protein
MGAKQSSGLYGPVPGKFDQLNISESTIQAYFNEISDEAKLEVKSVYDPKANVIAWMYRDSDVLATRYNNILFFNTSLEAFYPWKFSTLVGTGKPYIKGFFISERENTYELTTDIDPSFIEYVTMKVDEVRLAQASSASFIDWLGEGVGISYDSYLEAGFELFDDAMRDKNITYLFAYLRRTETEFDGEELDDPSSCYLTIKWDWASGSHSNKWTTPTQVYRSTRLLLDNPDTGFGMVVTKNKVRGNGKAIQFRFGTDEPGKNFDLQGWSIAVTGNTSP